MFGKIQKPLEDEAAAAEYPGLLYPNPCRFFLCLSFYLTQNPVASFCLSFYLTQNLVASFCFSLCLIKQEEEHTNSCRRCFWQRQQLTFTEQTIIWCLLGLKSLVLPLSTLQYLGLHHENLTKCSPICGNFEDFNMQSLLMAQDYKI